MAEIFYTEITDLDCLMAATCCGVRLNVNDDRK